MIMLIYKKNSNNEKQLGFKDTISKVNAIFDITAESVKPTGCDLFNCEGFFKIAAVRKLQQPPGNG